MIGQGKMRAHITNEQIREAWLGPELSDQTIELPAVDEGLLVRIRRRLSPEWVLQRAVGAKPADPLHAVWPEVSIAEALALARGVRQASQADGLRPSLSVAAALAEYRSCKLVKLRTGQATWRSLRLALAEHMGRLVHDIDGDDVERLVDRMAVDAPFHANRALAYLSAFFNWCIKRGYVDFNATRGVSRVVAEAPRERLPAADAQLEVGQRRVRHFVPPAIRLLDQRGDQIVGQAKLSRRDIAEAIDKIADRAPIQANRSLAYTKAFFGWCVRRGYLEANPSAGISKPTRERTRERTPSLDELADIWSAAGASGYPFGHVVRLLILTAARRDEVGGLRMDELELPA